MLPGLEEVKHKLSLVYLMMPGSKKVLREKKKMRQHVKSALEPA